MFWKKGLAAWVVAVCAAEVAVFGADEGGPGKVPFTISPETTVVTTPLRADGTPDYVGAINAKFGKGVTAENNGYVLMLQVLGTRVENGTIAAKEYDQLLRMLGIPENAADRQVYQMASEYWKQQGMSDTVINALDEHLVDLGRRVWREADESHTAEYLQAEKPVLDEVVAASERPRR